MKTITYDIARCDGGFDGNKQAENSMLVSALRRLQLRGHLDLVYQPQEDL